MASTISTQIYTEMLHWIIKIIAYVGPPIATFYAGLFSGLSQHVQKPLAEYRQTLIDISQLMLRSVPVLYEQREKREQASPEAHKLYNDLRELHGRLVSSSDSIPAFAWPVLRMLRLIRSRQQIREGAKMLIGISNELITFNKSISHVRVLSERLKKELRITV